MAPEQLRGQADVDARADVYGFGATAYELLTGRLPHSAPTPAGLLAAVLGQPPLPFDQYPGLSIPTALGELILRCLTPRPDDRPASASELESALLAAAQVPARSQPGAAVVGQMAGSYRIERRLAGGGCSSVFLAEHVVIGTRAAVKVLQQEVAAVPTMVQRFIREAKAASQLSGAHVPRYYDFGNLASGEPFAVMEYLEGESLADLLQRRGRLPLAEAADILLQVARVMAEAHGVGIVHRDLKPDNLFLVPGQGGVTVKILDFGIAAFMDGDPKLTTPGLMMGIPVYCAPEQVLGDSTGPAADIYALGVTAFEMLAGECPFDGETSQVLLIKSSRSAPSIKPRCPGLPDHVALTISRMLTRDPAGRPASMAVVAASMASWRAEVALPADQPPGRIRRRWKLAVYPAGAALLGALAVTWWLGRDAPPQPAVPDGPVRTVSRQPVAVERPVVVDVRLAEEARSAGSSQPRSAEVAEPTRETGSVSPPPRVRSKARARRRSTGSRRASAREPVVPPEPQGREEPDPKSRVLIADPFEE